MFVRPTHGQRKVLRHNDSELPRVGARPGGGKGHVVGHHAQHQCAVGNRGGKRPVLAHLEPAVAAELAGHHSEAGLETEQSAIGGRDADRAEAVVPVRQLDLPAGHRRSRSTGRAAWGSRRVPRVACHGLLVVGGPPQAQLGYGGEADDHCARGSKPADHGVVTERRCSTCCGRPHGHRLACDGDVVLDGNRHAGQGQLGQIRMGRQQFRLGDGLAGTDLDECADGTVAISYP